MKISINNQKVASQIKHLYECSQLLLLLKFIAKNTTLGVDNRTNLIDLIDLTDLIEQIAVKKMDDC